MLLIILRVGCVILGCCQHFLERLVREIMRILKSSFCRLEHCLKSMDIISSHRVAEEFFTSTDWYLMGIRQYVPQVAQPTRSRTRQPLKHENFSLIDENEDLHDEHWFMCLVKTISLLTLASYCQNRIALTHHDRSSKTDQFRYSFINYVIESSRRKILMTLGTIWP